MPTAAIQSIVDSVAKLELDLEHYEAMVADDPNAVAYEIEGEADALASELKWITIGLIDGYSEAVKILHPEAADMFPPRIHPDVRTTNGLQ